jgi:hypothetical protein
MEQVGYTLRVIWDEGLRGVGLAREIWEALEYVQTCVKTGHLETYAIEELIQMK